LSESLQAQKDENERLKQYLNDVIKEVEEKAPMIKRQKHEYDEAVKTVSNLTSQLGNAMMDYEVLKSKSEDSIKKYNSVSSENIRLKQDVGDLSRQVTVLLYEVEQLRSKMVSGNQSRAKGGASSEMNVYQTADSTLANLFGDNNSQDASFAEVSSSSEIANKNAFLFRNIEEMQKQNQKLVRMLNEISDKKQSEERSELEQRTKEYTEKLTLALRELEEMRNQREKQEHILEEIRKQRDTYKNLLGTAKDQHSGGVGGGVSFFTSTPGGEHRTKQLITVRQPSDQFLGDANASQNEQMGQPRLAETAAALDKLQKQFEKYQEETLKTNKYNF
jgi:nucleoprotein TPR